MPDSSEIIQSQRVRFWRDPDKRAILYQLVAIGLVGLIGYYLFTNTQANLRRQSIATGFDFLKKEASFEIGESLISYSAANTYARALLVGALNTLKVACIGVILTIFLGTVVGVARLSSNWLVSKLSAAFIEIFQDIPVLLQLFFWYAVCYENLPSPRDALHITDGIVLCNRGFIFAVPMPHPIHSPMLTAFIIGCIAVFIIRRWAKKRQEISGQLFPIYRVSIGILAGLPFIVWMIGGAPMEMDVPKLAGFNFEGGVTVSPEFGALVLGLVLYTSAFVAEIVRAGIQSVSKGQTEAAMSVGLKPFQILNLVILPQALRVIIPPLTSQMLNLTKNSTLAVAIGFPDFVSVANTTINQTGQAIEGVCIIMAVYLCFSILTSLFMNRYNKKMAIVER